MIYTLKTFNPSACSMNTTFKTLCCLSLTFLFAACGDSALDVQGEEDGAQAIESSLNSSQRKARSQAILNAAAQKGLTNGFLLAGVAMAETGMAHCWSEARWACKGPASNSCGGGPVIAGSGDGPCWKKQGGLGMFQFDGGTFSQTLARDGRDILTVEGNTKKAVDFVVNMVIRSKYISNVSTRTQALNWMNAVRPNGHNWNTWIKTVTHYYNGCIPGRCRVYNDRIESYSTKAVRLYREMGHDFWYANQNIKGWKSDTFDGDLSIRASWVGSADLDLFVTTPSGETLYYKNTSDSHGGQFTKNACSQCSGDLSEEVSWSEKAPQGTYKAWLQRYDTKQVDDLVIELWRAGAIEQSIPVSLGGSGGDKSEPVDFNIGAPSTPTEPVEPQEPTTFEDPFAIQLTWKGSADLDLIVTTPSGERIFYDNTRGENGGAFTKNKCMLEVCNYDLSEEVSWDGSLPKGDYKVEIVNYNGRTATDVELLIFKKQQVEQVHELSIPAIRRTSVTGPTTTL